MATTTPATPAGNQVNLPFSYHYHRSKGTSLPHQPETRIRHTGDEFARQTEWKKHKLCLLSILLHLHLHDQTGRNDTTKPTVYYTDDNGSPCHMDNSISFQRVIDRQDRTPVEGRFNYWNHRSTPWIQEYPHYYRTRTRRKPTTCLVGQPPLRLHPAGHDDETPRKTPRRRQTSHPDFASHLDIQDYSHQDYQPSTLTTNYLARPTNGNSFTGVSHLATNSTIL